MKEGVIAAAVIALAALCGYAVSQISNSDVGGMNTFLAEYAPAHDDAREAIAEKYLREYPAKELLSALQSRFQLSVCHVEAHPVGRAIYRKTQNLSDSIFQCGNSCSGGCFHGVLMELFSSKSDAIGNIAEDDPSAYFSRVQAAAKDLCSRPDVRSLAPARFCVHGLGHVFSYTSGYDLKKSVDSCGMFKGAMQQVCAGGVFMEYYGSGKALEADKTAGAHPCDTYKDDAQLCFRYKAKSLIAVSGGIPEALKRCAGFAGTLARDCIQGISFNSSALDMLESSDALDTAVCGSLSGAEHSECEYGAIQKIVIDDSDASDSVCGKLDAKYASLCSQTFRQYNKVTL